MINILLLQNLISLHEVEMFASRLVLANLITKTDFDNKLIRLNRKINSNKTNHELAENKLKKLQIFDSTYFSGKTPVAPNYSITPKSYFGSKTRVKFNGSCLKQNKNTCNYGKIVSAYIVYEINKHFNVSSYPTLEKFIWSNKCD